MGALLERFRAVGIRFETAAGDKLCALGDLTDELRSAIRAQKPAILAELLAAANDSVPPNAARNWQVHVPHSDPMEVIFTPEATRSEAAVIYPGATIEALSEPPRRTASPTEREELARLLAVILPGDRDSQAEAMVIALADVDSALVCFRELAVGRRVRA